MAPPKLITTQEKSLRPAIIRRAGKIRGDLNLIFELERREISQAAISSSVEQLEKSPEKKKIIQLRNCQRKRLF